MQRQKHISLAARLIQVRSFMRVFFALIIMLPARKPSSSITFTSHTSMNLTGGRALISGAPTRRRRASKSCFLCVSSLASWWCTSSPSLQLPRHPFSPPSTPLALLDEVAGLGKDLLQQSLRGHRVIVSHGHHRNLFDVARLVKRTNSSPQLQSQRPGFHHRQLQRTLARRRSKSSSSSSSSKILGHALLESRPKPEHALFSSVFSSLSSPFHLDIPSCTASFRSPQFN